MPGIATTKFRILNAQAFVESFTEAVPTNYYYFIGRNQLWPDESNPPLESDTNFNTEIGVFDEMMATKKLTAGEVTLVAKRYDWVTANVFAEYTSTNANLANSNFYVITDEMHVYKCLFNNNGANSTVKPTGTNVSNDLITGDGYIWKYMFSLNGPDASKFLTSSYIPVKTLTSDDGSSQWNVQTNATSLSIHAYKINSGGSGYVAIHTGTIANTNNTTTVSLASAASANSNFYANSAIYIDGGSGAGQVRFISAYSGSNRRITVTQPFSPMIDGTSTYRVSPAVNIVGDGTGASGFAQVSGGVVTGILPVTRGVNYSRANVTITAGAGVGTGATATPYISPISGHGGNPVEELYAFNAVINVSLAGNESNTFTTRNEYRTIGVMQDPLLANNSPATGTVYDLTTRFGITSHNGVFQSDEVITGASTGATARLVEFTGNTFMRVNNVVGGFANGENIVGGSTGFTATINSLTLPAIKKYSGEIIYFENRPPIARSEAQTETLKLVVKF